MRRILENDCGIYKLTNIINNKFYIGSTYRLRKREVEHKYRCKSKSKENLRIRNTVLKYGEENFKFEVIEYIIVGKWATDEYLKEILETREQYYVDILNPEYNVRKIDVSRNVGVCSEKQREHLRNLGYIKKDPEMYRLKGLRMRGKYKGENNKQSLIVDIYNAYSLELIETIKGIRNAAIKFNTDCSTISHMCKERNLTKPPKCGFVFRYSGDKVNNFYIPRKEMKKFIRTDTTPILQINENGDVIKEWRTCQDAQKELNLHKGAISRVLSGKYKHTKGYYFKYKN